MIMNSMIGYLQRGDLCFVGASMTLNYQELEPNASSIISWIDASCIKLTAYKELHNVT